MSLFGRGTVGSFKEIRRNNEELSIEWRIPNFFSLSATVGDYYESMLLSFCNSYWRLNLFPCNTDRTSGAVGLSLIREDAGPNKKIIPPRVGLKGWDEKYMKKGDEFIYDCREAYNWRDLCLRSDLKRHRYIMMPSDLLTFVCELKVNAPSTAKGVSSYRDASVKTNSKCTELNALTVGNHPSEKQDASSQTDDEKKEVKILPEENGTSAKQGIESDIGKLLESGECSDTVVQVQEVQFQVHRAILSVRSPVLFAMLRHDTVERATNRISVGDCDPDVFREYLHYVYTGSVRALTPASAFGLYRVADKYLADDLKSRCLEHIQDTLCVETFCRALQLALTHGENGLLELAMGFATKNFRSILLSVEWQDFICEYPREANEILIKCYNPPS